MSDKLADELQKPFPINNSLTAYLKMQSDSIVVSVKSKEKVLFDKTFTNVSYAYDYIEQLRKLFGEKK